MRYFRKGENVLPVSVLFLENSHGFDFETPKLIHTAHNTSNDKLDNQDEAERCLLDTCLTRVEQSHLQKICLTICVTNTYHKG